jgi:hypothetical protein
MKLRGDVDAKTFREVTAGIDAVHDQLAHERNRLASEAAMPEPPDPSLAWEDLWQGQARVHRTAGRQDHHRSASPQDRRWPDQDRQLRSTVARSGLAVREAMKLRRSR